MARHRKTRQEPALLALAAGGVQCSVLRLPAPPLLARRFAPDPAAIPEIIVELAPLHLYDELGTVRLGDAA